MHLLQTVTPLSHIPGSGPGISQVTVIVQPLVHLPYLFHQTPYTCGNLSISRYHSKVGYGIMIATDISLRHTDSTSAYNFTMEVLGYIGGYTSMVPCMWFNLFHYSLLIGLRVVALPLCVASVTQATGCLPVTMS